MENTPNTIKKALNEAITEAIMQSKKEHSEDFFLQKQNDENLKPVLSRNRILDKETVIKLILSMGGGSLQSELLKAKINATVSAFVQQRKKIDWTDFEAIFEGFNDRCNDSLKYKGYRIYAIDGTTINLARNEKSDSYVRYEGNEKGFNQLHANILFDVMNHTYKHCLIQPQPQQDEVGALVYMLNWYDFEDKTLIIADRGYESYNVFAHFIEKKINFLIRVKQNVAAMREISKLPMTEFDTDISFGITTSQCKEHREKGFIFLQTQKNKNRVYSNKTHSKRWDFASPYFMTLRVIRIKLPETGEYETLVTNLPKEFTSEEIKELYFWRWKIEISFREAKNSFNLNHLHSKADNLVKQEIYAAITMYNFCNRVTNQIVIQQSKKNIYAHKVNFKMAILLCKQFYRAKNGNSKKLLSDIAQYTEPVRPGRRDERNLKVKSFSGFTYRILS